MYIKSTSVLFEHGRILRPDGVFSTIIYSSGTFIKSQVCVSNMFDLFRFFRFCSYELRCQCSECKRRCSNFHNTSIGLAGFYAQVGWGPPVVHRYVEHLQDKRTLQAVLGTVKWTTFQKGLDQRFLPCCCYKPSSEMQPSRKSSKRCPIWRTQCVACILSRAPFV